MGDENEQWLQFVENMFERVQYLNGGCLDMLQGKSTTKNSDPKMVESSKRLWERACHMRSMSVETNVASRHSKIKSFVCLKRMHELFAEYYRTVLENKTRDQ